ncbi:UNVERIFIED_CONTAM: hypothetical protein Sradi_3195000 [Sesamum radiatum]|uniref:Reverse transcriptase zinc-binding domain-containing protein n=1 Tax=Sesamum radiatum TaxID=300843 RepID=A0AAW2RG49_SESRA
MSNLFWNCGTESKIHWKAWPKLCLSKASGGLGFRRLKEHNLKYFPGATSFEARLGSSPSYIWRSIWEARDLLAAGIRWQVGDGHSSLILGHPWLPRPSTFQPIALPVSLRGDTSVASLITANKDWNEALNFSEQTRTLKELIDWPDMRIEGSCSQLGRSWSFIWSSKALPKVVLFAWKSTLEALPTSVTLKCRGLLVDEECGDCLMAKEDVLHVLCFCSFARLVWAISGLPWSALVCDYSGTEEWFRSVFGELDRSSWDYFLSIC